jgi:hypothetical protein
MNIFILASKNLFSIRLVVFSSFFLKESIIKNNNHLKSYNIFMVMNFIPFTNFIKMNLWL